MTKTAGFNLANAEDIQRIIDATTVFFIGVMNCKYYIFELIIATSMHIES